MSENDAPIDPLLHDMEPELDQATEDSGIRQDDDPDLPQRPPEAPDGPTEPEAIT